MTDWFRSWHGAPTDPKWLLIARKANTMPGIVSAVGWALFDHASQAGDRGSVEAFDAETYAAYSGFEEQVVMGVLDAMVEKKIIISGRLAAWDKRQPKREDAGSTDRVRAHRGKNETPGNDVKRNETPGNAPEQSRVEEIQSRVEKKGLDEPSGSLSEASSDSPKKSIKNNYPEAFEAFWRAYPTDQNMSKKEAHGEWKKLPAEDRQMAIDSLPAFKAYCKAQEDYRTIHANRYLSKRRFEGHLEKGKEISARMIITPHSPQWATWRTYYRDNKNQFQVKLMEDSARDRKSYYAPSEWPPSAGRRDPPPPAGEFHG